MPNAITTPKTSITKVFSVWITDVRRWSFHGGDRSRTSQLPEHRGNFIHVPYEELTEKWGPIPFFRSLPTNTHSFCIPSKRNTHTHARKRCRDEREGRKGEPGRSSSCPAFNYLNNNCAGRGRTEGRITCARQKGMANIWRSAAIFARFTVDSDRNFMSFERWLTRVSRATPYLHCSVWKMPCYPPGRRRDRAGVAEPPPPPPCLLIYNYYLNIQWILCICSGIRPRSTWTICMFFWADRPRACKSDDPGTITPRLCTFNAEFIDTVGVLHVSGRTLWNPHEILACVSNSFLFRRTAACGLPGGATDVAETQLFLESEIGSTRRCYKHHDWLWKAKSL